MLPKYLCSADLKAEHGRRHEELLRLREREEIRQKHKKAIEDEKRFKELKSKFFGICFTDGTIQVHVLESVQEHLEEGVSMHHCVFSNAYYLKEDSLILSATIEGKRIETIEASLRTLEVVQSRGVCNKNTDMKTEIENIIYNYTDELKIGGQSESQIPHILIRVINAITLSDNEKELRTAIGKIAEETELDKFFAYGYGAHHFWLKHHKLSNGEPKEYRLLKVEF